MLDIRLKVRIYGNCVYTIILLVKSRTYIFECC